MSDNGENKPGHHKFDALNIGAPSGVQAPFAVKITAEGDHVAMRFEFRLRREEALKFASIMMGCAMALKEFPAQ
jgi:hypothetical protein